MSICILTTLYVLLTILITNKGELMSNTILTRTQISRVMAFTVAMIAAFNIVSMFQTNKAQAAWVNKKTFSYSILNSYCGSGMYASNVANRPDTWHCLPNRDPVPLPFWIRPGDACKRAYGNSFSFIVTNWNYAYGGYCAQWR